MGATYMKQAVKAHSPRTHSFPFLDCLRSVLCSLAWSVRTPSGRGGLRRSFGDGHNRDLPCGRIRSSSSLGRCQSGRPRTYRGLSLRRSMKIFERSQTSRRVHSCPGTRTRGPVQRHPGDSATLIFTRCHTPLGSAITGRRADSATSSGRYASPLFHMPHITVARLRATLRRALRRESPPSNHPLC